MGSGASTLNYNNIRRQQLQKDRDLRNNFDTVFTHNSFKNYSTRDVHYLLIEYKWKDNILLSINGNG